MVPTVVLAKNEYFESRLDINEKEQWIVVSRFFDAAIVLLFPSLDLLSYSNAPLRRRQLTHSLYF